MNGRHSGGRECKESQFRSSLCSAKKQLHHRVSNKNVHPHLVPVHPQYVPIFRTVRFERFCWRRVAMPSGGSQKRRRRKKRLARYLRKLAIFFFSHIGLAFVSVAYMIAGAIVFKYIEAPHELDTRTIMSSARNQIKDFTWRILRDNDTAVDLHVIVEGLFEHWDSYKHSTINSIRRGYDGRQQLENIQWSFSGAFFYSLTTISTVGYGNIACRTTMGRAVTILYAIFGIPLMLLFLAITGDTFSITCKFVYRAYVRQRIRFIHWRHQRRHCSRVNSALGRLIRAQLYHTAAMYGIIPPARVNEALLEEGRQEVKEVTVPIVALVTIMVAYLLAGATLFSFWENWTFEEGFYFCFVSLALIGFGDLFPGAAVIESWEARNKIIICALYLLIGMALIAMCFNLAQEDAVKAFRKWAEKLGLNKRETASGLTRRSSRSIDPRDIILEGGPIGGPNEAPPLTVGDFQAVLTATGILAKSQSFKRRLPSDQPYSEGDASCDTPPSTSSAPVVSENTKLLQNGNPNQYQPPDAVRPLMLRRLYESSSLRERRQPFPNVVNRKMNDYQFI